MYATEYAKIIRNVRVFKGLEPSHLERLVGVCTRLKIDEEELALRANGDGEEIFIVLSGRLAVISSDHETLALINPGLCVGEMAVFTNRKRSADVKAVLPTEVLKLHRDDLFQFVEDEPVAGNIVYRNVIEMLSSHMANNNLILEFSHILDA
jgi:CRP-like cAMP-binding protein